MPLTTETSEADLDVVLQSGTVTVETEQVDVEVELEA
jgi:hypothetical protein